MSIELSRFAVISIVIGVSHGCATAESPVPTTRQTAPVEVTTDPSTLTSQSSIDDILDALERSGQNLQSLTASVKWIDIDPGLGETSSRSGKFWLEMKPGDTTRARILFTRKDSDNCAVEEKLEYLLDGNKLIDRNYRKTTEVTRIVLAPGEKMNLLKLGEGPFPLPIGQKREDVHRNFDVAKPDPATGDPAGTVHVRLIPKSDTSLARKFRSIDVWVDAAAHLPRVIKTVARNGTTEQSTELNDAKVNGGVKDSDFQLDKIGDNWTRVEEAYQGR